MSWDDFDKALESDTELYDKLISLARDKEIDELKRLLYVTSQNKNGGQTNKDFQNFVPLDMDMKPYKFKNKEHEVYYYNSDNDIKKKADSF